MDACHLDDVSLRFHQVGGGQNAWASEQGGHLAPSAHEIKQPSRVTSGEMKQGSSSQIVHQHYTI